MFTTFDLDEYVFEALRAGASGFLVKDVPPEAARCRDPLGRVGGLAACTDGNPASDPGIRRATTRCPSHPSTRAGPADGAGTGGAPHDGAGRSNAEIAEEVFVSESTVKTHVGHVLAKLGVRDRVQAVVFAYEWVWC